MKKLTLVLGIACACAGSAYAGVIDTANHAQAASAAQTWSAWGGEIGIRWNPTLLENLGVTVTTSGRDAGNTTRDHDWFSLRESGGLEFSVRNATLQQFDGGSLQMRGGYVLRLKDGSQVDLRDFTLRVRPDDPKILDVVSSDGKVWFFTDRIMFELVDDNRTLAIRAADLRIMPELARRMGAPEVSGYELGDMALNTEVNITGSGGDSIERVCTPYPWPGVEVPGVPGATYEADLFMQNVSVSSAGCNSCTGPTGNGTASFVPSSTLRNNINDGALQATIAGDPLGTSSALYTANVAWYSKFSGNSEPYGNDQHPFLIWNLYRIEADGRISQIGRSGVKHAFLTVNGGCADNCNNSHSLGRGCTDTYGTGNNDSPSDMGPRSEIIPATGQWGRCGSIYDPDCNGSSNNPGNDSWTQRMKIPESKLTHANGDGVSFLFESWYIARDDINIYNSMATQSVNPQFTGSQWTPSGATGYALGSAIDRWVNPANPGANAMNTELDSPEGHAKVAVKVTALGNSRWRYDYAVMNFDFARAVTQGSEPNLRVVSNHGFDAFSIPIPAGSIVSAVPGNAGEKDPGYNWRAHVGDGQVEWNTDTSGAGFSRPTLGTSAMPKPLDWGVLYSFTVTTNRPPTSGTARLGVAEAGSPAFYEVATLVPGTASAINVRGK
jgi:hypothetical protein